MISIDLITGFLGSGKTTFIKKYAKYLIDQGKNIGILENDFGAVNVDAMLLQDILGDNCTLEMVSGGCDADCHRRRFKTKLIAMGMCGYDRVLVEPSGIFDMDEFFDALHEDPLDRWYQIGNVITIIDANLDTALSESSRFLLASQAAQAGTILYSHVQETEASVISSTSRYVSGLLEKLQCPAPSGQLILQKDWDKLVPNDFEKIMHSGYHSADYRKLWLDEKKTYDSLYFMNMEFTENFLRESCVKILKDPACGKVFRIKGFQKLPDNTWIAVNATHQKTEIHPIPNGQAILIVIGEGLHPEAIESYWGKSKP
ncbi:GTP-binding protein [Jutongia sp.]|uniref:GTP-binding protein n=1 Tax=Jutongia sp. TaxID=2944204 RepID=UPI00307A2441